MVPPNTSTSHLTTPPHLLIDHTHNLFIWPHTLIQPHYKVWFLQCSFMKFRIVLCTIFCWELALFRSKNLYENCSHHISWVGVLSLPHPFYSQKLYIFKNTIRIRQTKLWKVDIHKLSWACRIKLLIQINCQCITHRHDPCITNGPSCVSSTNHIHASADPHGITSDNAPTIYRYF